jgi:hypothetical protein
MTFIKPATVLNAITLCFFNSSIFIFLFVFLYVCSVLLYLLSRLNPFSLSLYKVYPVYLNIPSSNVFDNQVKVGLTLFNSTRAARVQEPFLISGFTALKKN